MCLTNQASHCKNVYRVILFVSTELNTDSLELCFIVSLLQDGHLTGQKKEEKCNLLLSSQGLILGNLHNINSNLNLPDQDYVLCVCY